MYNDLLYCTRYKLEDANCVSFMNHLQTIQPTQHPSQATNWMWNPATSGIRTLVTRSCSLYQLEFLAVLTSVELLNVLISSQTISKLLRCSIAAAVLALVDDDHKVDLDGWLQGGPGCRPQCLHRAARSTTGQLRRRKTQARWPACRRLCTWTVNYIWHGENP